MEAKKSRVRYGKVFWNIIKKSKIIYIFAVFIFLYFVLSAVIFYAERSAFDNYGDALWFSFVSMFTIGYGDYNVTTIWSRLITIILVIYATIVISIFTAVLACVIGTLVKETLNPEENDKDIELLTNLESLNKEQLTYLSNKFKDLYKNKKATPKDG